MTRNSLESYRLRARAWIHEHLPLRGAGPRTTSELDSERLEQLRGIQQNLFDAGFAGFTFPAEYGGAGLTLEHERVFQEEAAGYELPPVNFGVSINIIGAALLEFGSEVQRQAYIPNILSGRTLWTQFLSEPSGGSDLAGLMTSARRDGSTYLVNGQKTWTSFGHLSDMALCPVRTRWDVPKHQGISMLIMDLKSPGIEMRRIKQIDGGAEFCEEFLTDVVVPVSNILGEENQGWRVARGVLEIEHAWVGRGGAQVEQQEGVLPSLVQAARRGSLAHDLAVRRSLASLQVHQRVQQALSGRVSDAMAAGRLPHAYGGVLKLGDDLLGQRQAELALELTRSMGVVWSQADPEAGRWSDLYLDSRRLTIAGGTSEMQRNNLSEQVLGLPRERGMDRDLPFDQVPHN